MGGVGGAGAWVAAGIADGGGGGVRALGFPLGAEVHKATVPLAHH